MKYTLLNKKVINIPDKEIENNMKILELTKEEAIQMWLEDNEYLENEEQAALDTKAKAVKINHCASSMNKTEKTSKPRTVKISDEKQLLFTEVKQFLLKNFENIEILKENKLISVKIGEKTFKIDIIEQRPPKK